MIRKEMEVLGLEICWFIQNEMAGSGKIDCQYTLTHIGYPRTDGLCHCNLHHSRSLLLQCL